MDNFDKTQRLVLSPTNYIWRINSFIGGHIEVNTMIDSGAIDDPEIVLSWFRSKVSNTNCTITLVETNYI